MIYAARVWWKMLARRFVSVEQACRRCGRRCADFDPPRLTWTQVEKASRCEVLCFECFCWWCERLGIYYGGTWHLVPDTPNDREGRMTDWEDNRLRDWYEFNDERARLVKAPIGPAPNGIACPRCGAELLDTQPNVTLTSDPARKEVRCPSCGFSSTRVA